MIVLALALQASVMNWVEVPRATGEPDAVLVAGFDPEARVHSIAHVSVARASDAPENDFYYQEQVIDCDAETTSGSMIRIHYRDQNRPTLNIPIIGTYKFSDLKDRSVADFVCRFTGLESVRGYEYVSEFVADVRARR